MRRKQLSNYDKCPNPRNNSNCKKEKAKISKICGACYAYSRKGLSFLERFGEEKAKIIKEKQSNGLKEYLANNPDEKSKRIKRCKDNADFYQNWIDKYGKDEADRLKEKWKENLPKFKKGLENPNYLEHIKEMRSKKSKELWKNKKYRKKMLNILDKVRTKRPAGFTHSLETKRKMRLKHLERLKEVNPNKIGSFRPNYNPAACDFMNKIMEQKGTFIQHGCNIGEYFIKHLGFWLDGYDQKNNIVYEFYEKNKHFSKGVLKEKDISREKEIINYLKCKFIRIYENGKTENIT